MARKAKNNNRGHKTKAGMLLSKYIKEIADEATELLKKEDTGEDEDRMATKAEALARTIWKLASGFDEVIVKIDKDGKRTETTKRHGPNSTYVGIVLDRTEGRAPLLASDKDAGIAIADRVSAEGKNRINNIIKDRKK